MSLIFHLCGKHSNFSTRIEILIVSSTSSVWYHKFLNTFHFKGCYRAFIKVDHRDFTFVVIYLLQINLFISIIKQFFTRAWDQRPGILLPCLLTHTGWELTRPVVVLLANPHWRTNQPKARIALVYNCVSVPIIFSNDLTIHNEFRNSTVTC